MHPIAIAFVSLLQAAPQATAPTHGTVTVRSLVQGSGTVVVFSDARDMRAANGGAKSASQRVHCTGILRHCFYGTYSCVIALEFASEAHAADARRTLGPAWKPWRPHALIASLTGEELEAFKARPHKVNPCGRATCRHGCKDAPIDNVNHSIDYGATWTMSIETTPAEQLEIV